MTSLLIAAAIQLAANPSQVGEFEAAYQRSIATGRPLVVLLGAQWCPSCQVMQRKIMPEVEQSGGLRNVEYVYVDVDSDRRLSAQLSKAKTIPQLIRYYKTPDGWRYNLLNGAYPAAEVKMFIETGFIRLALVKKSPKLAYKGNRK